MKNSTKRTIAAMSAVAMLAAGGVIGARGEEPAEAEKLTAVSQAAEFKLIHNYITGEFTVGKSDEENAIASSDGELYLYENDSTFVVGADGSPKSLDDIREGDVIAYYINADAPTTLQLPVHYTPDVIVIEDENVLMFREIGVFDEELVNSDNTLKLNVSEETVYYSHTREGMLISGKALVFYDSSTKCIPAQTTPVAIVKLSDDASADEDSEGMASEAVDISGVKTIVVGEDAQFKHIPVTVNGVQMLPVRAIAEALGFDVVWEDETKTVYVGHSYFTIDEDSYVMGKMAPQSLGQAPVLIAMPGETTALTYVPVTYFTEVLGYELNVDGESAEFSVKHIATT